METGLKTAVHRIIPSVRPICDGPYRWNFLYTGVTTIGTNAFPRIHEKLNVYCHSSAVLSWVESYHYPKDDPSTAGSYCYSIIHAWDDPTYTWAEDNSSVTAGRVCT